MATVIDFEVKINNGYVGVYNCDDGAVLFQVNSYTEWDMRGAVKETIAVANFLEYTPFITSPGVDALLSLKGENEAAYFYYRPAFGSLLARIDGKQVDVSTRSELIEIAKRVLIEDGAIKTDITFVQSTDDDMYRVTYFSNGNVFRTNSIDAALEMAGLYVDFEELDADDDDEPEFFEDEDDDAEVESKSCSKCSAAKPIDQFYAQKGGRHGRRPECIECTKAADAARRQRKKLRTA